ncbi:hypothetical protein EAE98_000860 [Botrytis deweyae]|uniref:Uncharacterized protein n=1 Tax=Botrytis deweyae TaxID=2478750 RepID=A0ABQ7J037_9HELO|nr:hypothetical protein EAE98_000860 [Botrytis deweyae]
MKSAVAAVVALSASVANAQPIAVSA